MGALLEVTESYVNHVLTGDTLLCPVYLHFQDLRTSRCYFVMKNMIGSPPFEYVYDLKGCADDKTQVLRGVKIPPVSKRIWKVWMWCGDCAWSKERFAYYDGKLRAQRAIIHVTESQRERILKSMKRDVDWLVANELMDYSCLVAAKVRPVNSIAEEEFQCPFRRRRADCSEMAIYVAIIDWLQKWTASKQIARALKCLEGDKATIPPDPYGRRFCRRLEERFAVINEAVPSSPASTVESKQGSSSTVSPAHLFLQCWR